MLSIDVFDQLPSYPGLTTLPVYYYTSIQVYLAKSPGDLAKPPGDLAPHFEVFACVFAAAPPPPKVCLLRRLRRS